MKKFNVLRWQIYRILYTKSRIYGIFFRIYRKAFDIFYELSNRIKDIYVTHNSKETYINPINYKYALNTSHLMIFIIEASYKIFKSILRHCAKCPE